MGRGCADGASPAIVKNGIALSQNNGSKFALVTQNGVVVFNRNVIFVTCWSKTDFDKNMLNIIESLFRM